MTSVAKTVVRLLQSHDCVIVPDFGGFVLNETPARISGSHLLLPPSKTVGFNRSLRLNDGLLINSIASSLQSSYGKALQQVSMEVSFWKEELDTHGQLTIEGLGLFTMDSEGRISFEPEATNDFLKSAYGLTSLQLMPIENVPVLQEKVRKAGQEVRTLKGRRVWLRKAAVGVSIALVAGAIGLIGYNYWPQQQQASFTPSIPETHTTEVITSMPKVIQEAEKQAEVKAPENTVHFYVIGGSFNSRRNATRFHHQLEQNGYKSEILNTENGFYRVAYLNEADSATAEQKMLELKESGKAAWILKW